jgi:hypothetical protein
VFEGAPTYDSKELLSVDESLADIWIAPEWPDVEFITRNLEVERASGLGYE